MAFNNGTIEDKYLNKNLIIFMICNMAFKKNSGKMEIKTLYISMKMMCKMAFKKNSGKMEIKNLYSIMKTILDTDFLYIGIKMDRSHQYIMKTILDMVFIKDGLKMDNYKKGIHM